MTEGEYTELIDNEHTVWCTGQHDRDGECINEVKVSRDKDATVILLNGVPTDHQYIEFGNVLTSVEEIDAAIAILARMREQFAAQDVREAELDAIYEQVI